MSQIRSDINYGLFQAFFPGPVWSLFQVMLPIFLNTLHCFYCRSMSKIHIKRSSSTIKVDDNTAALKLQDDITCKGCFKEFNSNRIPKILHCLHNLCSECINMYFGLNPEKNTVMCPTCKINCVGKGAETFRTHSYVQIISDVSACYKDQMNGTLKCIGCSNVAGLRCLTCNENYCQEHTGNA